jgi:uncharacterized RDD family membrane protein YckC
MACRRILPAKPRPNLAVHKRTAEAASFSGVVVNAGARRIINNANVPDPSGYSLDLPMMHAAPDHPPAGLLRRLAAIFYDSLLLSALWLGVATAFLVTSGGRLSAPDRPLWLLYAFRATLLLVAFLFFGWFWTRGGQTLGMRAWRLKVVADQGQSVTWLLALRRFAAAGLSWAVLGVGFWWVTIDPEKRAWHDRLSGTNIVVLPKPR